MELKKGTLIWYKVYVLRTSYVEKSQGYYLFMNWFEIPLAVLCVLEEFTTVKITRID